MTIYGNYTEPHFVSAHTMEREAEVRLTVTFREEEVNASVIAKEMTDRLNRQSEQVILNDVLYKLQGKRFPHYGLALMAYS